MGEFKPYRDPFECDEYPPKMCEECEQPAIEDVVCYKCGYTVCLECCEANPEEWHEIKQGRERICKQCGEKEE